MQDPPYHPLEPFFGQAVRDVCIGTLGLRDEAANGYVTHLLCDFSDTSNLYKIRAPSGRVIDIRDESGCPIEIERLSDIVLAADPIYGIASSFDDERAIHKHIGDYALFIAGMYPESGDPRIRHHPSRGELIRAGIGSYQIVGQFDLFEYAQEAPIFTRLSDRFESYATALTVVRDKFSRKLMGPPAQNPAPGPTG